MAWTEEMRDKAATTRQMNREARLREKAERQQNAGIPDSRPFGGDPAAETNPILDCHVGGTPVRDLPLEAQARILYQQTDEGIATYNEGRVESAARVTSEPSWDKALEQRRDDVKDRGMDSYEARDPMKEAHDQHIGKGFRGKFLSARKIQENGGTGDYEVVKDAKGDPVKVKGMVLGQMPEAKAKARNRHYQNRSNQVLKEMTERYKQEGGRISVSDQ